MKVVELYTDGSCKKNPGPGGWASILKYENNEKILSGGREFTTNNQMELLAVINGLKALKFPCFVKVTTDSQYVANAFNKGWIHNWLKEGLLKRKNGELWEELVSLCNVHKVQFIWIRGHNGHIYNERCDKEAQRQANIYSEV